MITIHESGLFVCEGARVLLNKLPRGVKGYSIANADGQIIIEQPAAAKYKFFPLGNILVVNLENGEQRKFRFTVERKFIEVAFSYIANDANLEGEQVLCRHLGFYDK